MPGVGSLDHSSGAGMERLALLADHPVAAEDLEQIAGLAGVIAGVEMHGDLLREIEAKPAELVQYRGRICSNSVKIPCPIHSSRRLRIVVAEQELSAILTYAAPSTSTCTSLSKHDPVRHPRSVATQRVLIEHPRDAHFELVTDRFNDR